MSKKLIQAAAGAGGESVYVEDVFSTYLYEGNGTSQTITNDIDLDGEGGMVWIKNRDSGARHHNLYDTERGATKAIYSNQTWAEGTNAGYLNAFNSDGFSVGNVSDVNGSGEGIASWSFRKAEKFFDVVTYTGNGSNRTISHSLGSVPGFIVIKRYDASGNSWYCYHSSLGNTKRILLSETDAEATDSTVWNSTTPTDSVFSLGTNVNVNASGGTYVAYLFASDAGGFGDDDENIIKCGSFSTTAQAKATVDLGFESQWVMVKRSDSAGGWIMTDIMRGAPQANGKYLYANLSDAEASVGSYRFATPTATGFAFDGGLATNADYIYIAIRRPMKTPESGTEVFTPTLGTGSGFNFIAGFPVDMAIIKDKDNTVTSYASARLNSGTLLSTSSTAAEFANAPAVFDSQVGYYESSLGSTYIGWLFKRATGFFDVVAYTGDGTFGGKNHNLGVVPELIINKGRNSTQDWYVWLPNSASPGYGFLRQITAFNNLNIAATSTTFDPVWDTSSNTYIAYLFATLDGVSKVGSYSATGSDLNVDCGFSAGARFILIKRTDSTGDWYVYDSERGIVAGNDPYLLLNTTAAEVTNTDYIDPLSSGFTVTSSAPAGLNASGGTYIFLAIA